MAAIKASIGVTRDYRCQLPCVCALCLCACIMQEMPPSDNSRNHMSFVVSGFPLSFLGYLASPGLSLFGFELLDEQSENGYFSLNDQG